ncbi:MAG: hypothetical protein KGY65_06125 [Candidatus Thermoplasmatota archaeon]|nr:hypothetical protein [Candidatus Thermoplasmatota archaeon]MBS3802310.1 hypothetical protein [Candidatus Thermoplasmatota archaeon]
MTSSRIKWITENQQSILNIDFTDLYEEKFITEINNLRQFLHQTEKTEMLALIDINDSFLNTQVFDAVKNTAKLANIKVKKTAIIGSTPVQKTFIKIFKTISHIEFNTCKTKKQAIHWLTKEQN